MGQDFILDDGCVVIDKHLLDSHSRHLKRKNNAKFSQYVRMKLKSLTVGRHYVVAWIRDTNAAFPLYAFNDSAVHCCYIKTQTHRLAIST